MLYLGLLKWYNVHKGYGVIQCTDGNEVFFHQNDWNDDEVFKDVNVKPLVFEIAQGGHKTTALNVSYFRNNPEDWAILFDICENEKEVALKNNTVEILPSTIVDFIDYDNIIENILNGLLMLYNNSIVKTEHNTYLLNTFIKKLSNLDNSEVDRKSVV